MQTLLTQRKALRDELRNGTNQRGKRVSADQRFTVAYDSTTEV